MPEALEIAPQAVVRPVPDAGDVEPRPDPGDGAGPGPSDELVAQVTEQMVADLFQMAGAALYGLTEEERMLPRADEHTWLYPAVTAWANADVKRQRVVHQALAGSGPFLILLWAWIRAQIFLPAPVGEGRPFLAGAARRAAGASSVEGAAGSGGAAVRAAADGGGESAEGAGREIQGFGVRAGAGVPDLQAAFGRSAAAAGAEPAGA